MLNGCYLTSTFTELQKLANFRHDPLENKVIFNLSVFHQPSRTDLFDDYSFIFDGFLCFCCYQNPLSFLFKVLVKNPLDHRYHNLVCYK